MKTGLFVTGLMTFSMTGAFAAEGTDDPFGQHQPATNRLGSTPTKGSPSAPLAFETQTNVPTVPDYTRLLPELSSMGILRTFNPLPTAGNNA